MMERAEIFGWVVFIGLLGIALVLAFFAGVNYVHAGTCYNYSDGGHTVQSCDNGSAYVIGHDGYKRQYGHRNSGFERYPGNNVQIPFISRQYYGR